MEKKKISSPSLNIINIKDTQQHPFHVLTSSKLPILTATLSGGLALTFIAKLHNININDLAGFSYVANLILDPLFSVGEIHSVSTNLTILGLITLLSSAMWAWSINLFKEATKEGHHTIRVQLALKYGMLLFLVSEAMLFFPFFWAFFHGSLSPSVALGAIWPPVGIKGIETLDPFMLPLVNTLVLLCSGVAIVGAHRAIIYGHKSIVFNMMYLAISFGIFFSCFTVSWIWLNKIYNKRWIIWICVFYSNRLAWISCYCWYNTFINFILTNCNW